VFRNTSADGRFNMHGWPDAETLVGITATHRAAPGAASIEVPIGTRGVELVLADGGSIAGSVLLDADVPPHTVSVSAHKNGDSAHVLRHAKPFDGTRLVLPNLRPGTYSVTASADGDDALLALVGNVEVRTGERTMPPELNPLDLRGRFHRHAITVVDDGGRPLRATVYYRAPRNRTLGSADAADPRWATITHVPGEPALAFSGAAAIDVTATAKDHGWCERRDVAGAITLVCGATYEVRLRLARPLASSGLLALSATLRPASASGRPGMSSETADFDADGVCVLHAEGLGEHVVDLLAGSFAPVKLDAWPGGVRLDVVGSSLAQELVIDVPASAVEDAWRPVEGLIDVGD
jgi:hypothetical protein